MKEIKGKINWFLIKWKVKILLQSIFYSFGLSLILILLGEGYEDVYYWAYGLFVITLGGFLMAFQFFSLDNQDVVDYLNKNYDRLQSSASLILKEDLSVIERIQLERIKTDFHVALKKLKPPINLFNTFLFALFTVIAWFLSQEANQQNESILSMKNDLVTSDTLPDINEQLKISFDIDEANLRIIPPSYTGLSSYYKDLESVSVPEGSSMVLKIRSKPDRKIVLINNLNDTVALNENKPGEYFWRSGTLKDKVMEIGISEKEQYISVTNFSINIIPDEYPQISYLIPEEEYQVRDFNKNDEFEIKARIVDDYGLVDTKLIATVSRGSGESVKFRDETFDLSNQGNNVFGSKLSVSSLSLEPGDEIYFHFEATDNKSPNPNIKKSQTRFIRYLDKDAEKNTFSGGMAVDIMPEYFRSQRQIIIDTKKLINDRSSISPEKFRQRSNELGYEQKLLRIRYSKFMGEEFETGGLGISVPEGASEADDASHAGEDHEDHEHHEEEASEAPAGKQELIGLDDFVHTHDVQAEATFFDKSIKSLLRAALNEMWQAELNLRLNKPAKALPYEESALLFIKEIQQRSRIYVERVGFEPPPINVSERRYKGELNEIGDKRLRYDRNEEKLILYQSLLNIKRFLAGMESDFKEDDIRIIGNYFSEQIVENNNAGLIKPLSSLKRLNERKEMTSTEKSQLLNAINLTFIELDLNPGQDKTKLDSLVYWFKTMKSQ
ncbi:hypothetical protein OO013_19735 [Mangrovivirga sp. M17]|uniref:DUF4175 family protein n=1 Tax=Mangrovivirga halotolerans TaxID=2993936 RepID=A0ABT3RWF7_9BACT|nr:DUF4175 family protein [Mangrovivirga halotolerans]MCX2746120.1 hypothetical protein [Mangrovivirga halotolerans]